MKRVEGIDICRGLLALSVAVYHYAQFLDIQSIKSIHAIMNAGITSVDGFFIVSGFALFYTYHATDFTETRNVMNFFYKRFSRIAPLFYLCMLLNTIQESMIFPALILVCIPGFLGNKVSEKLVKYAFMVVFLILLFTVLSPTTSAYNKFITFTNLSFLYGFLNTSLTPVRGGWSIGIEFVFYFSLPFIVSFSKNNIKNLIFLTLVSAAVAIGYQMLNNTDLYTYDASQHALQLISNWPIYSSTTNHFYFFMFGVLLYPLYCRYQVASGKKQSLLIWMMLLLLIVYCASDKLVGGPSFGFGRFIYSFLITAIVGLTPFILIKNSWIKNQLLLLGDISYSVYLMQFPVYSGIVYLTQKLSINKAEIMLIALISLLLISYLIYKLYEMPTKKWLSRINFKRVTETEKYAV